MELLTLKELCESVGASRRSIQCYEKAGLMMPTDKNKYGHLLYDINTMHRAEKIRFMQELGFKLKDIKEIIDAPREVMKEALERRVKELEEEIARLDQIIKEAAKYMETLK
ncbi:MerR family transcriptional regulator [Thermoguttaceae bacterium LCP21S3_D4]